MRCRCGYEFNETVDHSEENDDYAVTIQEEELYLEYLNARAQQAAADARDAAQAAAAQPNNKSATSQAQRAQIAAKTAHAEFESQQARVATAIKALKGNNPANSPADSGSARQTSAPAISQALPFTAAPPRVPPKATVPPAPAAMSGQPANVTAPVKSSPSVNGPSAGQEKAVDRPLPAQAAGATPTTAVDGTATPHPIAPEKVKAPVPTKPAASAAAHEMPEKMCSANGDRDAAKAPEPHATPPANREPVTDERAADARPSAANAADSNRTPAKPKDAADAKTETSQKGDGPPKTAASAATEATPKPSAPDTSADKQPDAASAKALAAAARAKELTAKLKAAQAARAAKAKSASAAPSVGNTAPTTDATPPNASRATQASSPPAQTMPHTPAASVAPATRPVNGEHRNGHDKLVAELDAIQIPGADTSQPEPVSAPPASAEVPQNEPDSNDVNGAEPAEQAAVAPTVTVSVTPSADPQAELEAALRALTARTPAPVPNERPSTPSPESAVSTPPPQTDAAGTRPAAVSASMPADRKDCPNCTALLPLKEMRCRCGYTFPTVDETMPALSLSDSDLAAMGDESQRDRITHLS